MSLPPIDAPLPPPPQNPVARSEAEQAALEAALQEAHELLGVKRGAALEEAMKPELIVPTPSLSMAVAAPQQTATAAATAQTNAAPTAATAETPPEAATAPLLALPAPEDVNSLITLDCTTGQAVTLDHMGPVVVNTDGTLSRITNWLQMSEQEQDVTKRRIAKRNIERLKAFRDRGELKDSLVSALS